MDRDVYALLPLPALGSVPLSFRISSIQGFLARHSAVQLLDEPQARLWGKHNDEFPDLYVEVRVYADNKPLSEPVRTSYKSMRNGWRFNESITFATLPLSSLPLNSQVGLTIWDSAGRLEGGKRCVGGTTFKLFGKKGTLKTASHRLFVWPEVQADGSAETSTPSKQGKDEMGRLEKLIKLHEASSLPRLAWLDKLTYRQIERINAEQGVHSKAMWLYVDLPRWDAPVVWCELEGNPAHTMASTSAAPTGVEPANTTPVVGAIDTGFFTVFDAEQIPMQDPLDGRWGLLENPIEAKSRRLARSHRNGPLDRELKPDAAIRDELNDILSYPPTRALTSREADLLWSFRFYLSRFPGGLTKFLKSVSWSDQGEAKQATEVLMPMWAKIGLDDALELLGPGFRDQRVRHYAVQTLERADDDELILYLLQLVQALKFDDASAVGASEPGPLTSFGPESGIPSGANSASLAHTAAGDIIGVSQTLRPYLINRALKSAQSGDLVLANNLYWYLTVETEDKRWGRMYRDAKQEFLRSCESVKVGDALLASLFKQQAALVAQLSKQALLLRSSKDARPKKIDKLRAFIADPKSKLQDFEASGLPLPLDATVRVSGIRAEESTIFKSNLFPLLLQFDRVPQLQPSHETGEASTESYGVIFKNGDDLRQDQLVIQLFTLMDKLLRNENLDLRMTPYRVLATASLDGMVQFVQSASVASILSTHSGSLLNYLRSYHPDETSLATYGVKPEILDTFIRSCAGYCVVTYLLGVGDRHLDNLLLAPDGHFFHAVDFGYILGRDPKPFPPAVKLCKEMVDCMGGTQSQHYLRFKSLAHTAFATLRKNANLILNLIALMVDANVPDIRVEPDKAVLKVQEKFRLELGEEEAIQFFDGLLNETSYVTMVFDRLHDAAQFFRS
ncbi:phosphatidylinositol 3-kinase [Ceraceosorus guamensis]|uniref:Phosphatidylinositol 3-kinase VPS34 n=1 Tax=Ceraceosorus guamensis TaxID=1522189 RepID=A0A316W4N7_9BASI|nr:phosphatidylinositol 3-kinase [Ceraceosorus guamensis]PWN44098.1 phosphatidylinositol 3-kinase [Ceraceosorus guamensis]